jgi:hypothetical protein
LKIDYKTIKIDDFTLSVLKGVKDATGRPISRIIKDLVKAEFPNKYKGVK